MNVPKPSYFLQRLGDYLKELRSSTLGLFCLVLILASGVSACARNDTWEKLSNEAMMHYQKGDYDKAAVTAKRALEITESAQRPRNVDIAQSLNNLGFIYMAQGHYSQAEPLLKRAL